MWKLTRRLGSGLLSIALALSIASPAFADTGPSNPSPTVVDYPAEMPAIGVSVIRDNLDARGRWTQTVRLTIQPGGTLADASLVAFGDVLHVDTLFQAAQKANPRLYSPAMIPIGQQIDLTIDPSTTFVLQTVLHGSNTLVRRFTNGVVDTSYTTPNGSVTRTLAFPDGKPSDAFAFPASPSSIRVRPGGHIVDLRYARGQSFADVVHQTYGITTYAAAVDLTKQTGWNPTHWPPPIGDVKQIVTAPPAAYQTAPREAEVIPNPDPAGRAQQVALHQARLKAGIYVTRQEAFDTVYHVAVTDPSVTASSLSRLLYGSPDHRLEVARAAGYQLPTGNSGNATAFDPQLLGRSFDVVVGYEDENFVVSRSVATDGGVRVELVDGARITSYPNATHGLMRLVQYPTQYKRIVYRPSTLSLLIARGIAIFHVASAPGLPSGTANALADEDAARILWQWSPGLPRQPGDIADSVQLVNDPAGPVIEVMIGRPVPQTPVGQLADRAGLNNPLIATVTLVMAGTVIAVAVDLGRRYARRARSPWL